MENLELTPWENLELEKRGFFVKKISNFFLFLKSIISIILIINLLGGAYGLLFDSGIALFYLMIIGLSISSIMNLFQYIKSSSLFYTSYGLIGFGNITNNENINLKIEIIGLFSVFLKKIWNSLVTIGDIFDVIMHKTGEKPNMFAFILFISVIAIMNGSDIFYGYLSNTYQITGGIFSISALISICIQIFYGFVFCCLGWMINKGINFIHPLYTFSNLGENIQKLTPSIEKQSKNIQSEFESTMDFSVLNHEFDVLSRNLSKIVQLIIKLEKVEKRANKGNLFDSEKYINSLRSDIVTPLISLKTFLEEKKIELIQSKQELTQVQVGGSEKNGNVELQSKRSDPLILELTENIEKLDVMIEKMG